MGRIRPRFASFEPSSLRVLAGPTSPASLTSPRALLHFPNLPSPRAKPPNAVHLNNHIAIEPPSTPMPWIWSCHKCHTRYLLGATRRCLHDGHYFCGGTTVDKVSGKLKKHRACVSEFDYTGWEEFSRWKRMTTGQAVRPGRKHCEDECEFPSSCHWKEQHAVQEPVFAFPDPSRLDKEPDTSSVTGTLTAQKSIATYTGELSRAAERRTSQAKALLSAIEEDDQRASSSLDTAPELNGLGLHSPVMAFSSAKIGVNESRELVNKPQINLSIPQSPQMLARVENVWEDDVDMTDWISRNPTERSPVSPCTQPAAVEVSFDFGLEQDQGLEESLTDDDSPISPMRSAWDWTVGGIGVALSPPVLPIEDEMGEEEMEEEMDDVNMLWDKRETTRPDSVDRRISI